MRPRKSFPLDTTERMEILLADCGSVVKRRRIECVYLRAKYNYSVERISELTKLRLQTVRNIHSAYLKDGEACLKLSGKGGRKNYYLCLEAEAALLADVEDKEKSGYIEIGKIHAVYQKKVGKKIALTTTYRMLHRHGWRKIFGPRSGLWSAPQKDNSV